MKRLAFSSIPVIGVSLLLVGGGAMAAPVVTDPLTSLPSMAAPTAVVADTGGGFFSLNSGLDSLTRYTANGVQTGARAALLPIGAKSSAMVNDQFGSIFVANPGTHSVSKVDISTSMITPFAFPAADVPVSLALDSSRNLYVTKSNDEIARIASAGTVTLTFAKLPMGSDPRGVVADSAGNVYTANFGSNTVSKVTPGGAVTVFATLGGGAGPVALTISKGKLYVANQGGNTVSKFDLSKPDGTAAEAVYALAKGAAPVALVVDEFENVYVADSGINAISVVIPGKVTPVTVFDATRSATVALAITSDNRLLFASKGANTISAINLETKLNPFTAGAVTVGSPFAGTVSATGVGGITFASPDLPAWLTLDAATGKLSGTPTAAGPVAITLRAVSETGRGDAFTVRFDVAAAQPTTTPAPTATATPTTPGATTGAGGSGAGVSGAAGTGGQSAGGGSRQTGALASTGAADASGWGVLGGSVLLLGFTAFGVTRQRRRQSA